MPRLPLLALSTTLFLPAAFSTASAQSAPSQVLEAQILLDRAHHSPGVIDGKNGGNTRRALRSFERANGLPADGELDPEVMKRLRSGSSEPLIVEYRIEDADVSGLVDVPDSMEEQAKLERLGFETAREALAEKFHMGQDLLSRLNPGASFRAGERIRVVRAGADELGTPVARIEIDTSAGELRAFGAQGQLVASYPATIGSERFPSPCGTMEVRAVASQPTYYFNPDGRDWGPDKRLTIAAGPNNPVGSTWIDLTKEGYGIHGTPEPRFIAKTPSHGCVRLTNWDAEELATAVEKGTTVTFL